MTPICLNVLKALAEAGGQIDLKTMKGLCVEKGDAQRLSMLMRSGLAEYVRPDGKPLAGAIGIRLTDWGRKYLGCEQEQS